MPVTTTYPGVYIEELPSGVHTITGVATSIAAFIGWAPKGPVTQAQLVLSWSDFNNQFGGLDSHSLLGYAVSQFFTNGGQQAYIIRLVATGTNGAAPASGTIGTATDAITLTAQNPGAWGNDYSIAIKNLSGGAGRFRLQVVYTPTLTVVESFENLSLTTPDPQGRYVTDVVNNGSSLITVSVIGTPTLPTGTTTTTTNLGSGTGAGASGTVLTPGNADFETALLPISGTTVVTSACPGHALLTEFLSACLTRQETKQQMPMLTIPAFYVAPDELLLPCHSLILGPPGELR